MKQTTTININVEAKSRAKFNAYFGDTLIVERSATPFLDAARALKAMGYADGTIITQTYQGSSTIGLTSTIGKAAKLSLTERDDKGLRYEAYRPYPSPG